MAAANFAVSDGAVNACANRADASPDLRSCADLHSSVLYLDLPVDEPHTLGTDEPEGDLASLPAARVVQAMAQDAYVHEVADLLRLLEHVETLPGVRRTAILPLDELLGEEFGLLPFDVPVGLVETATTTLLLAPEGAGKRLGGFTWSRVRQALSRLGIVVHQGSLKLHEVAAHLQASRHRVRRMPDKA